MENTYWVSVVQIFLPFHYYRFHSVKEVKDWAEAKIAKKVKKGKKPSTETIKKKEVKLDTDKSTGTQVKKHSDIKARYKVMQAKNPFANLLKTILRKNHVMEIQQEDKKEESKLFVDNISGQEKFTLTIKCDECGYEADNIILLKKHKTEIHKTCSTEE